MSSANFEQLIKTRLARMESRMVEGFQQLGANVKEKPDGRITVDKKLSTMYIHDTSVTIGELARLIPEDDLSLYDVVYNDKLLCVISKE